MPVQPQHYDAGLLPTGMTQHYVKLSTGIKMHYLEMTPESTGVVNNGVTIVFVHGFPELSFSWKDQMKAVAQAGFIAVAPDMRGYGFTDAPKRVDDYSLFHLTGDLCALLDSRSVDKAVFIGHDWGGHVVWSHVFQHEDRCLAAAVLNTPLSTWYKFRPKWEAAGCKGPMEYFLTLKSEDVGELDYQAYFNLPNIDVPKKELEADVERTIHAFFRSQISSGNRDADYENMKVGMRTAKSRKDNNRGVLFYCPKKIPRDPLWTEEEMQVYISSFERTGFFGPISWYRNIDKNIQWSTENNCEPGLPECKIVKVPCLMVTAEHDVVLAPEYSEGMESYFSNFSRDQVKLLRI